MLPLNEGTSEWLEELARSTGNVVAQVWRVQLLANQACWGVPGGRLCQSSDLGSAELGDAPKIHTQDPPPILLLQWEEVRSMKLKSREVVPQEPTPPSVSEAQGAPTSGDTPSPPEFPPFDENHPLVPRVDMSPYKDLKCPEWVWEVTAGRPVPGDTAPYLRRESEVLADCKEDVPLTPLQIRELLDLIKDGSLWFQQQELDFSPRC